MIEQETTPPTPDVRQILELMKASLGGMLPRQIALSTLVGFHAGMKFARDTSNAVILDDQIDDCMLLMQRAQGAKGHDMTKVIETVSRLDGIAAKRN